MTVEQVKADLKAVVAEFFTAVERRMGQGDDFQLAVMTVSKARPDLIDRETSLRGHLKALGAAAAEGLGISGAFACAAVTRLTDAAGRLPIAQLGVRFRGRQKVEITRQMLAEVVANFRRRDTGVVPVDYDHGIEYAAGSGAPVPAAGWITSIDDSPDQDGILWGSVRWTPRAAEMIRAGEYLFISPSLDPSARDNKTGQACGWALTSAALTNAPVLAGMPALVLSELRRVDAGKEAGRQVSNSEWNDVNVELSQRVKAVMAAEQLSYSAALQRVMLTDRDLSRRYKETKDRYLSDSGATYRAARDESAGAEISALVKAKVAASEGRIEYRAALSLVLSQRPDLAQRYKRELR